MPAATALSFGDRYAGEWSAEDVVQLVQFLSGVGLRGIDVEVEEGEEKVEEADADVEGKEELQKGDDIWSSRRTMSPCGMVRLEAVQL